MSLSSSRPHARTLGWVEHVSGPWGTVATIPPRRSLHRAAVLWRRDEDYSCPPVTVAHSLIRAVRRTGIPLGRWPEEGSRVLHLRRLVDLASVDLVLDVGAHHGEFAQLLREDVSYVGDIISFEPAADSARILRERSARDRRWRIEQIAVGDRSGPSDLHHYPRSQMNSLRTPTEFGSNVWDLRETTTETVQSARLDEIPLGLESRKGVFLKVDTQGHDLVVLAGAAGMLGHVKVLQIEVSLIPLYEGTPPLEDTLARVRDMGFAVSGLFPVAQDARLRAVELDLIAVREQDGTAEHRAAR